MRVEGTGYEALEELRRHLCGVDEKNHGLFQGNRSLERYLKIGSYLHDTGMRHRDVQKVF